MANRQLFQFRYSYERDLVDIYVEVLIGASGAVTSFVGKGVSSVVKETGAGLYTINLQDNFNKLMDMSYSVQNATGISAAPIMGIDVNSIDSNTAPLITVQLVDETLTAANPASGDVLRFKITARNAST
jgi:hypothetical protein